MAVNAYDATIGLLRLGNHLSPRMIGCPTTSHFKAGSRIVSNSQNLRAQAGSEVSLPQMLQLLRHAKPNRTFPRSIHRIRQLKPPFAPQALVRDEKFFASCKVRFARLNCQKISKLIPE